MKKKRSGKKKSNIQNNKPNNNGTTAEVTIAIDKHHNWSRPCSALAASISQEILPSLPSSNNGIVSQEDDIRDADGSTLLSKGKLLFTQQPLLAFMILQRMIEERKKIRAAEQEGIVGDKEFDNLLDSYIDCTETSTIIDNEAKKWGERDLDSFVAFLTKKYDCQKKMNKQNPLKLKDILPTISIESINSVLESVKCRSCRFSANSHLSGLLVMKVQEMMLELNPRWIMLRSWARQLKVLYTDPPQPKQVFNSKDTGEKIATNEVDSGSFNLELQPITQSDKVQYLQIGATLKEEGSCVLSYPLSTQDIINLTKYIILPKKINTGDKIDNSANPGDDELTEIAKEAFDSVRHVEGLFEEAKVTCNENILASKKIAEDLIEELEYGHDEDSIEGTRKKLVECNRNCDVVMKKIGDLLLLLFKKTVFVGWSNERGNELLSFFHTLWDRYNTASESLLRPTLCHRNKMTGVFLKSDYLYSSMKERNRNTVKQMTGHRSMLESDYVTSTKECKSLQELVMKKITALSDLVNDFSLYIGICQADIPNPLVVLCVKEAYRKHDEHPKESAGVMNQEEEGLFVQLIAARINLSQVTTSMDTRGVECMGGGKVQQRNQ